MVIGMGEDKTPPPFRKACDIFTVLELLLEDSMLEKPEKAAAHAVVGKESKKSLPVQSPRVRLKKRS